MNRACTATITADSTIGGNTPPLINTLIATFPPKPGQTWTLTIDGLAPWALNFTKLDSDGDPTGTGTQNGVAKNVYAFSDGSIFRFQVFDAQNTVFYCDFPNTRPTTATVIGGSAFTAPNPQTRASAMNRACSVTINTSTLLAKPASAPLDSMFIKLR